MILNLYAVLVGISLVLIIIGLAKPSESAQALLGFFFLFLLSMNVLGGNLEYETGVNVTYSYDSNLSISSQTATLTYSNFDNTDSHNLGLYMAIGSAVGFGGVLFSLARTKWGRE